MTDQSEPVGVDSSKTSIILPEPSTPPLQPALVLPLRERPMPNSKKKERDKRLNEMQAQALINSAVIISDADIPATVRTPIPQVPRPPSIPHSDGDNSEHSVEEEDASSDEGLDHIPTNLPETVNVEADEDSQSEEQVECEDALEGADVFKDVHVEEQAESEEEVPMRIKKKKKRPHPVIEEPSEEESSASSTDLGDLALDLTPEEVRRIRRKKKLEMREMKRRRQERQLEREEMLAKGKKDRFFDKSRNIPSEIYFGDIIVPLHVLHSYGSENEGGPNRNSRVPPKVSSSRASTTQQYKYVEPRRNARIEMLKKYIRAGGIKNVKYSALWKNCSTDYERITKMLQLLRQNGLEGDPTLSKCRALKRNRETLVESDELDTSVIINPRGRTLRSGNTIPLDSSPNEEEECHDL